jgi:4-hydroxybenzoate polyprenyltransferase
MQTSIPLCVDLDGTLVHTDTLLESFLVLLKEKPISLFHIPFWVARGKANLKEEISKRAKLPVAGLPVSVELIQYLKAEHASGRELILVTGANHRIGQAVAAQVGLFDEVVASDENVNLSGRRKAQTLVDRFGKRGFDYAGNEDVDFAVWAEARQAIVANKSDAFARKVKTLCEVELVIKPPAAGFEVWRKALRIHQWAKNLLIFVPLLGAHQLQNLQKLGAAFLAFFAFSLCASSVYLLNDLLDLEADRHHPTKRHRPFASGRLHLLWGMIGAPCLLAASILLAFRLPIAFRVTIAGYYLLTVLYSLRFKQVEILDVLTLAALYSIRVVAGGYAAQVVISDWLLAFSIFVFLSLAYVKRFTELRLVQVGKSDSIKGRGYGVEDLQLVSAMGVASGYLAVLLLALYVTSPAVTQLYQNPAALWFACPVLLYWISRVWLLAHRGLLHDDPIVFALKDKYSWLVGLILLAIGAIALPR